MEMDENQLVPAALKSSNHHSSSGGGRGGGADNIVIASNYNKLSDNIRRLAPHRLQCTMFCGGTHCKYENPDNWTSEQYAIHGIFSNWITDDILAMARPSTSILIKKNVIQQFHSWGIKSIINLQMPNEHASCGPPLEQSGYTYDPAIFMENNIYYYNFTWKDYGEATLQGLLDMVKVLAFAVKEGRAAIHCHAGLGRTGVLIACYLVYVLRVRANDAINYIRLKRPGSVQTRGQILCIQEFAQYILPQSIIYNIKEYTTKDKKIQELTLSKYLKNQRITLHGYEERSLKLIPKVMYRICERILILCNCWCDEFAIGNIAFTNNFLVTKLKYQNRQNGSNYSQTEFGSQQTLSNASSKDIKLLSSRNGDSSVSLASAAASTSDKKQFENNVLGALMTTTTTTNQPSAGNTSASASVSAASSTSVELLNDVSEDAIEETLRENKCYQILSALQCGSAHEIAEPYTVAEVTDALLVDYSALDESTRKYIRQFEIDFNCTQIAWSRLKKEKNLHVLGALLYDWLECLKYPIVNREDLSNIVIYYKRPETCLQKLNLDSQYLIEFIIRFLTHLQPSVTATTLNILKRFAASITQKTILLKNVILPVGKGFQKLRDGTLECLLNFLYSLYIIFEANRRQTSAQSSKFYEVCSGSSEAPSPAESDDDSADVECPGSNTNHVNT